MPRAARGMRAVFLPMTNTRNTPTEAPERAYPLRVLRYRFRRGAGLAPGGEGIERELEVLEACTLSLITERRQGGVCAMSMAGPAAPGRRCGGRELVAARWRRGSGRAAAGQAACSYEPVTLRILTPGGGGWGPAWWSPAVDGPSHEAR